MYVFTYQRWDYSSTMFIKGAPVNFVPETEEYKFTLHKLKTTRVTTVCKSLTKLYLRRKKKGGGVLHQGN